MPPSFVIVGSSLAGATAAATLRENGFDGDITLVGAEPQPPYERPPLSKQYLRGETPFEKALVRPATYYDAHRIDTLFGVRATRVEPAERVVHLETDGPSPQRAFAGLGMSEGLTGLTVSAPQPRGPRAAVVSGDPHVVDTVHVGNVGIELRRHVLAFFQGNRYLLPSLVTHVVNHVPAGSRVVDLYAGTGLFSMAAAMARGAHVPSAWVPLMASVPSQEMIASFSGCCADTHTSTPEASTALGSFEL